MKTFFKKIIKGGEAVLLLLVSTIIAIPFLLVLVPVKLIKKQKFDAVLFVTGIASSFDEFAVAFKETLRRF